MSVSAKGLTAAVVVPVYNVEDYLPECLLSLVNQKRKFDEIVLVDDGSTDESGALCDKFVKDVENAFVLHCSNGGLSAARNRGICAASSDLVALVDSDDVLESSFLQDLMLPFTRNPAIDIAMCGFKRFSSAVETEMEFAKPAILSSEQALFGLCSPHEAVLYEIACNKLYKRELFSEIRFPLGRIHEDTSTTYKLFRKARSIASIAGSQYRYRIRSGSITQGGCVNYADALSALEERDRWLAEQFPDAGLQESHREYYLNSIGSLYASCEDGETRTALRNRFLELYESSVKMTDFRPSAKVLLQRYLPRVYSILKAKKQ